MSGAGPEPHPGLEPLIEAVALTKAYRVYGSPWDRLRELVTRTPRHRAFVALEDVGFELPAGESLGILGQNGAGKSTLLRIVAGVARPTSGTLEVRGSVASLLELGMGFHSELSGRQNIRLSAAILGLTESELGEAQGEIEEFCELGSFLEQPVKTYSTGMAMRLGFAIAVQVRPRLLIVDEALSVGDGYFQKKCMDRIRRHLDEGRSLLFCSHSMYYVSAFCPRAIWLHEGRVRAFGPSTEVIREYESFLLRRGEASAERSTEAPPEKRASTPCGWTEVRVVTDAGEGSSSVPVVEPTRPLEIELEWWSDTPERRFHIGVSLDRADDVGVASLGSHQSGHAPWTGATRYRARLLLPRLPLVKGEFKIYAYLLDDDGLHLYDQRLLAPAFRLRSDEYRLGLVEVDHEWRDETVSLPESESGKR